MNKKTTVKNRLTPIIVMAIIFLVLVCLFLSIKGYYNRLDCKIELSESLCSKYNFKFDKFNENTKDIICIAPENQLIFFRMSDEQMNSCGDVYQNG